MKLLAIKNIEIEGLGNFKKSFERRGVEITEINAFNGEEAREEDFDILLILGGPMGVYEEDKYPFLSYEKELIKKFYSSGKKVLGVCLGAQLIASAFGAKVYKGKWGKEIGWDFIYPQDQLEVIYQSEIEVFHWHGDTFDLPEGAVRMASSVKYRNQAFRIGNQVVGLQFHLEVTQEDVEKWIEAYREELKEEGIDTGIVRGTEEKWKRLELYCDVFVNYFLKL
ncbi:glutamine amidotransferase-related protein [Phorcysia thermohydrogeniphila]|uniref:GMP synthase-like glutamine amidotransferase n=1 Tax=Phorcysia thermohydrogeniphila TaxID=936138 RepID=A0A4R1GFD9_9BACT|nr:GMP synthase [Phorcysia thermohydrogeniphila]TCK05425.1 GMP synthase-like glutamine amidotransferase [Phorcysia thermohydrogeniphila]